MSSRRVQRIGAAAVKAEREFVRAVELQVEAWEAEGPARRTRRRLILAHAALAVVAALVFAANCGAL